MVLVTGGTGITGAQLIYDLAKSGYRVRALKRHTSNFKIINHLFLDEPNLINQVEWFEADINDKFSLNNAFTDIEYVYHCAAFVSFNPSDNQKIIDTNVYGTEHIIDMCMTHKINKLCFVSSVATTGNCDNNRITESDFPETMKDKSMYAISKFQSEMSVWAAMEEGLKAIIVNPGIILGPGNYKTDSSSFISFIDKGSLFYPPGKTGFVDVRDLTGIMIKLMESELQNERFIIVSENLSYKILFDKIASELKVKAPTRKLSKILASFAWRLEKIKAIVTQTPPRVTKFSISASFHQCEYENKKVKHALNYQFLPIKDTIRFMVDNYKKMI